MGLEMPEGFDIDSVQTTTRRQSWRSKKMKKIEGASLERSDRRDMGHYNMIQGIKNTNLKMRENRKLQKKNTKTLKVAYEDSLEE